MELRALPSQSAECCVLSAGYQFNVQFLRYFLAPVYEIHEVRQAGEHDILVKWSWTMNFWWNRYNPLKIIWDPRLVFSGISILGYNPKNGKHTLRTPLTTRSWLSDKIASSCTLATSKGRSSTFFCGCHYLAL